MRRGEVWWASLPAPAGRRPVVLISRDVAYEVLTSVTVIAVTRTVRGIPVEVTLGPEDGMPKACAANADNIAAVPRRVLTERITELTANKLAALEEAVKFALDLP